jgi:phage gpG-like protein
MLKVTVTVRGDKETRSKLQRLGSKLNNMNSAMDKIGGDLKSYYGNRAFTSQGDVFGQPWRGLSSRYAVQKRKRWGNRPLLVASGAMQKSFYYKADNNSVLISNKSPYFKYHQSSAARYKLPRRQMMGINSAVKTIVGDIIRDDIRKKIRDA